MNVPSRARLVAVLAAGLAAACSSSSQSDLAVAGSVTQELTLDPNGFVTRVVFDRVIPFLGPASFQSDGGQAPLSVAMSGTVADVTWADRVTPAHRVRVVGVEDVADSWRQVVASDERTTSLSITSAIQDVSDDLLGGDELVIAFEDGPRVVEASAEDPASWALSVSGTALDLSDSTFDLDVPTQVLTITLGPSASLHATFALTAVSVATVTDVMLPDAAIAGVAVGDPTAPALEGATPVVQNRDAGASGDPLGRTIEFDFDEPISPVFGVVATNFVVLDHVEAVGTTLVASAEIDAADHTLVRVTFTRPVVPGLDRIRITNVRDAHGNLMAQVDADVDAGVTEPNGYTAVAGVTSQGLANDSVVVELDQAIDPDTADDPARWSLELGAPFGIVDLSTQELTYDLATRTLTIELDFDFPNGTTVDVAAAGVRDVDGELFAAAAAQVLAAGDSTAPAVAAGGIVQRRDLDASGRTIDVTFTEELAAPSAEDEANYAFAPAVAVQSALLQGSGTVVRLVLAAAAVPGDHTLTVAQAVADPAGNTMAAAHGPAALASTDTAPPLVQSLLGRAVEGANNDLVVVLVDDDLVPASIEDVANWAVESPLGTPFDVSTSTVTYDVESRIATLVVAGGALKRDDSIRLTLTGVRDLGGNAMAATPAAGTVIGETRRPRIESTWRRDAPLEHRLVVRFSEASDRLTDLFDAATNPAGVKYTVHDSLGALRGRPSSATVLDDGLGVELSFAFTLALTDTVDVCGLEDLAGNLMFPVTGRAIVAEDAAAPAQNGAPLITAVTGERNDVIEVTFAGPMATWGLTRASQYTLEPSGGGPAVDLAGSRFEHDGGAGLTITLSAPAAASVQSGVAYDLSLNVDGVDPLRTVQGVAIAAPSTELNVAVTGDIANGPTQGASRAVLDPLDPTSLLVVFDEAVDETAAETAAAYDYDGGNVAIAATLVSPRVVRATFAVPVSAGATVEVTTSAAVDLAGNASAGTLSLVVADDQAPPIMTLATATVRPDAGIDSIVVAFDEVLDLGTALNIRAYTVTDSRGNVLVLGASWDSASQAVTLLTADMLQGDLVTVDVSGVADVAGNVPAGASSLGTLVGGDSTPPALVVAYVNPVVSAAGLAVDVELSEPVAPGFADQISNWTTTGVAAVSAVEVIAADHVRLTLTAALGAAEQLVLAAGLSDLAGNATAAPASVDPVE